MAQALQFFDDNHALWETEIKGLPCSIADSKDVISAKNSKDYLALGKALTNQLRYREAADAYTLALNEKFELSTLRLRAGRYLATLQLDKARCDLLRCEELGADSLDVGYRLGICEYYAKNYKTAMAKLSEVMQLADDEMGIAIIYWHTLCAYRLNAEPSLLNKYHLGMEVGHHTGYEKAMRVCAGFMSAEEALKDLDKEEDLEYSIVAYGIAQYLSHIGKSKEAEDLLEEVRRRDKFWVSFAFLAAVNDKIGECKC